SGGFMPMQQFSSVLQELRKWFDSLFVFRWIRPYEIPILFGTVGLLLLIKFWYLVLPFGAYRFLNLIFHTIPVTSLAYIGFLLAVWSTLVTTNIRLTPYALWAYAFSLLFPFTSMSLSGIISAAV